ncbi:penicillin acylase family protein [Streptomyces iconiensis]|uniref:Penicillin acylase family protein n=1 Tax=Streptomyces iconiensis TaxID=1384038 RepID=A0ABT6ZUN7_9ACTN|nr:penicillin acylase family protein [Streptomyces iconiensis]MDJ1132768.1 penicillin acylase family protein [Streptomyces iconiensis]
MRNRLRSLRRLIVTGAALALAVTALPASAAPPGGDGARDGHAQRAERPSHSGMSAVIRYTENGIPHIAAKDYPGLGFGNGWAQAADQICVLADGFTTVRGERSRHFGATAETDGSLSSASSNLASDLYFKGVREARTVEKLLRQPAPAGPSREVRELARGWAAGYNDWLREHRDDIKDPACKGAAWLRPVTALDVSRRAFALSVLGGQGMGVDGITSATPPGETAPAGKATPPGAATPPETKGADRAGTTAPGEATAPKGARTSAAGAHAAGGGEGMSPKEAAEAARSALSRANADMGSNAVAFHGSTTANGSGALLGNPHYPWHGGRRFWQSQMTIPGELNAAGGSLLGSPTVSIGHNSRVAWSHTVATGVTLNLHQLALDPADPTAYTVDGKRERMEPREVSVTGKDGKRITRTQWWTRYGPVVTEAAGVELPWSATTAFALNDPNARNLRLTDTGLAFSKARDIRGMREALERVQGLPWVNTVAADARGNTLFAQSQILPRVTDELAKRCNTPLGQATFPAAGLAVLDGSRADCTPGTGSGAVQKGVFGPSEMPVLQNAPYVENSNDSAWLANADRPLTGYPRIFGDEGTPRSVRTRGAVEDVSALAREGGITRRDLREQQFANRAPAGDLAAEDTAKACAALPGGTAGNSAGETVDVARACVVIAGWDRTMRTGSEGALLFDRFWGKLATTVPADQRWRTPFDPAKPVTTPRDLNTGAPGFATALADAVSELEKYGIPLDAPLSEHQFVERRGKRIPVPGGVGGLGVWNMTVPVWDGERGGYREVQHGSSYIQAVDFSRGGGCPVRADTLLTYSQSSDPTSRHSSDQTELYSRGRMVEERFCEKDIRSSPELRTVRVSDR